MTRICHVAEIKLLLLLPMSLLSLVLCLKLTIAVYNSCTHTAQKKKFSIKDFFSKCDQIRSDTFSFVKLFQNLSYKHYKKVKKVL